MKTSTSKIKKPKCPNCKKSYDLFFDSNYSYEGVKYPYLLIHNNNTCPFGLEQRAISTKQAVKGVNSFLKEKFTFDTKNYEGKL